MLDFTHLPLQKDFRELFPEFTTEYEKIDKLGGANCKPCVKGKIRRLASRIKAVIESNPEMKSRLTKVDTELDKESFVAMLKHPALREFLKTKHEITDEYGKTLESQGYGSARVRQLEQELFELYKSDPKAKEKFDSGVKLIPGNSKESLYNNRKRLCKIIRGTSSQYLENAINEFCADKEIQTISLGADKAIIIYSTEG